MSAAVVCSADEFFKYFWVTEAAEIQRYSKLICLMYFHGSFANPLACGSYIFTRTISVMIVFVLNQVLCILLEENTSFHVFY